MVDAAGPISLEPADTESLAHGPRGHAVVELVGEDRCVQIAATADARSWLTERFSDHASPAGGLDQRGRPKTDLRAITRLVRVHCCGSALEADLRWLDLARRQTPDEVPGATPRLTFLGVGDEQGVARLVPVDPLGPPADARAVGPFVSAAAARCYASLGIELLGLSWHPSLLDPGSPEHAAYVDGLDAVLRLRVPELRAHEQRLRDDMAAASREQRFEDASSCKEVLDGLEAFPVAQRHAIDRLDRFRFLALTPAPRATTAASSEASPKTKVTKHVRPLVITSLGWAALRDRPADDVSAQTIMEADAAASDLACGERVSTVVAFASPHLLRPPKAASWFRLGSSVREDDLREAAYRAVGDEIRNDPAT